MLDIHSVVVNQGSLAATPDDALHTVAYFGDATGDGSYSGLDAQRVARLVVKLEDKGLSGATANYDEHVRNVGVPPLPAFLYIVEAPDVSTTLAVLTRVGTEEYRYHMFRVHEVRIDDITDATDGQAAIERCRLQRGGSDPR